MAVILSSMSIGVLAFSSSESTLFRTSISSSDVIIPYNLFDTGSTQDYAMFMMPVSLLFIIYALRTYLIRSEKIRTRDSNRWDDPYGPIILASTLVLVLTVQFVLKVIAYQSFLSFCFD
jgi:hypothetical protein